jgi:hypothetical protein
MLDNKYNSSGSHVWNATIGGTGADYGRAIDIDNNGNAFITGHTYSSNYPITTGVYQPVFGGNMDAFVTKLNPTGSALDYSTYIGRAGSDIGIGVKVDANGI